MLTRRDLAALTWYGLLFSAIVLWASLRPARELPDTSPETARPSSAAPIDHSENLPEMRRIAQRMMR